MSTDPPPSSRLSRDEIRTRRRELELRRQLARRLPLLACESLVQRLAGLFIEHPQQAGFVHAMTCRAQRLRLAQDLEPARELEADYEAHLAACGITETWYDPRTDESELLSRHYDQLRAALEATPDTPGTLARLLPRKPDANDQNA